LLADKLSIADSTGQAAFTGSFGWAGLPKEKPSKQGLLTLRRETKLRARFGETHRVIGPVAGAAREMMIYVS
jgi:hypothetical protein